MRSRTGVHLCFHGIRFSSVKFAIQSTQGFIQSSTYFYLPHLLREKIESTIPHFNSFCAPLQVSSLTFYVCPRRNETLFVTTIRTVVFFSSSAYSYDRFFFSKISDGSSDKTCSVNEIFVRYKSV